MAEATVEQRLSALERDLAELRARVEAGQGAAATGSRPSWLEGVVGSMKGFPEFEEVVRLGRAARHADRPSDDDEPK